ncbi:hypothetical protein [Altibacter sp.]|nr:hypothetical protein [Altibacter sp.]MCW9037881.1 hypothetical protein [Altibacter sp.]
MEKALNYRFTRRSANYMEWLCLVIKSEYYFQVDSRILPTENSAWQTY